MKRLFFLSLFACLAAPAFAQPEPLPPEVRAMMPQKVVSLGSYELSPAPKAPVYLVHVWTAPRRDAREWDEVGQVRYTDEGPVTEKEIRSKKGLLDSPVVMDIFSNPAQPKYRATLVYSARRAPHTASLRYFNSRTKQGLVFQVDDVASNTTIHAFFVFPYGLDNDYGTDTRVSHSSEGGYISYKVERGTYGEFELVESSGSGGANTTSIFTWNGRQFAQSGLPIEEKAP